MMMAAAAVNGGGIMGAAPDSAVIMGAAPDLYTAKQMTIILNTGTFSASADAVI